jgi:hypothetical protein
MVWLGLVAGLVGCGGPPPPPVSIQLNVQPTTGQLDYLQPNVLTGTLSNATNLEIEWQLSCPAGQGAQCGTLSYPNSGGVDVIDGLTASVSGQQINYLPPGSGVYTVTFTATSVADKTKMASATITRGYPTVMTFDSVPTTLAVGSSGSVSALLTSDPIEINVLEKLGYTWTVTCASKDCGTFSNSPSSPIGNNFSSDFTTAWGYTQYIQYNAPATVPSGGTVTVRVTLEAESTPDPSQPSATSTITITPMQ